jgi:O-antigen ligase
VATGFFANSNHMAALLVVCVPILFALVADVRGGSKNAKTRSAMLLLAAAGIAVIGLGIVLNGSIAVLLLGPPVLLVSATMLLARKTGLRKPLVALAALGTAATLLVYMSPLHDRIAGGDLTSIEERREMWANTSAAIPQFLPLGSGVSSFPTLYPRYEDMAAVTRTYTNHAHNDYLELALETGIPGVLLLIAFLWWWAARTRSIWRPAAPDPYAQAATIITAALLLHSIVDYPLRTAALSAVMAAFLAIMAHPRETKKGAEADLWPTRHAEL